MNPNAKTYCIKVSCSKYSCNYNQHDMKLGKEKQINIIDMSKTKECIKNEQR